MYRKKITVMIETHISLGFCGYYCFSLPDIIPITIIDNSLLCAFLYFITIIISLLHEPYCNIKYYIHIIYFRPLLVDIRSPTVSRSLARAPKQGFPNPGPNTFFYVSSHQLYHARYIYRPIIHFIYLFMEYYISIIPYIKYNNQGADFNANGIFFSMP